MNAPLHSDRLRIMHAYEDASVNFVSNGEEGTIESRYVRRGEDYFIAYVSSQTGCDRSCRFCHLTATGQTSMGQVDPSGYAEQVRRVLSHHERQTVRPDAMNVNFMARGEPLMNPVFSSREEWRSMRGLVLEEARMHGVHRTTFNVSTIMPAGTPGSTTRLGEVLGNEATIYYSLYSIEERFRRRWLPKAMPPHDALRLLSEWQDSHGGEVVLHWSFIEDENDDLATVHDVVRAVRAAGLRPRFNAVRFNPPTGSRYREPDEIIIERNFAILADAFGHPSSRIVPRVGMSVKASCGMFVDERER